MTRKYSNKVYFQKYLKKICQDCYVESMDSFGKLFEDKNFYDSVMQQIAKEAYKNLISR